MVDTFVKNGYDMLGTDIRRGNFDFYKNTPATFDAIVTNPPFDELTAMLRRLIALNKPFAFLAPLSVLDSKPRVTMMHLHGVHLVYYKGRINYLSEDGTPSKHCLFSSCWVVHGFDALPAQRVTFLDLPE